MGSVCKFLFIYFIFLFNARIKVLVERESEVGQETIYRHIGRSCALRSRAELFYHCCRWWLALLTYVESSRSGRFTFTRTVKPEIRALRNDPAGFRDDFAGSGLTSFSERRHPPCAIGRAFKSPAAPVLLSPHAQLKTFLLSIRFSRFTNVYT